MGKASRRKNKADRANKQKKKRIQYVDRPFEALPFETELVAMREILPSATLRVHTNSAYGSRELLLVTMLPEMVCVTKGNRHSH